MGITDVYISTTNKKLIAQIGVDIIEEEVIFAIERIKSKPQRKDRVLTSVHEAGHAILMCLLFNTAPDTIVSNAASLNASGFTGLPTFQDNKTTNEWYMIIAMGGRAAEQIVFGKDFMSSGSSNDLLQATSVASCYVKNLGFGTYNATLQNVYAGKDSLLWSNKDGVEQQIELLLDTSMTKATELLIKHRNILIELSELLIENEKVTDIQCKALFEKHNIQIEIIGKSKYMHDYVKLFEDFKQANE